VTVADYVYGVVEGTASAPVALGIRDSPLRLIAGDGAAALISDLAEDDLRLGREELLTHGRVLAEALSHGTVLPMRFGVVMSGDDEVRAELLAEHAHDLRAELERMAGKVEVNIRATYDEQRLMQEVVAESPEIAELRHAVHGRPEDATYYERIQLGELVAKELERRREHDAQHILDALLLVADDVDVAASAHVRVVLSASFLVQRGRLAGFDQVLQAVAEAHAGRLRFKYTGPLPPQSFVELAQGG
jgi:hypothetical protein